MDTGNPVHPDDRLVCELMDTRLLRMFQAVARHGGLVGAAHELHLTPSALSHRLKVLETDLGCRLFERSGRRLVLNQAGEQLLAGIERPLETLDETAAGMRALSRWGQGRLRIGVSTSLCERLVPQVLGDLRHEFAGMHFVVESGDTPEMVHRVRDRRIDLAVGVAPEPEPGLESRLVFEDELLWVLPPDHPWLDGRPLSKSDMRKEPLIAYRRGSVTARLVDSHFRGLGIEPMVVMEMASVRAIKEAVRLKLGVAVLAPWAIEEELRSGVLGVRPLGAKALRRRWVMVHASGRRLGLAEETCIRLMEKAAAELWKDRDSIRIG